MKKIIFFAFAAAALMSCVEENLNITEDVLVRPMTISAGADVETKAHLDGKIVNWDATDVLGVYDGTSTIREFTTSEDDINGASATFSGEAATADMYYAVYPYSDAVRFEASTETFIASIPTTQTASLDNGFMNGAYVAVAKADCASGESLMFKNVCGYIKVTVSEANVKKVVVKSASGSKLLTGKIKVKVTDGDPETTVYDGSTLVCLVPAGESDYIAPGTYYIAVAPQNLNASEYSIRKVYDSTMKVWTGTKAFELKRNTPVNFGDLAAANFTWEEFTQVDLSSSAIFDNSNEYGIGAGNMSTNGTKDTKDYVKLWDNNKNSFVYLETTPLYGSTISAGYGAYMRWVFKSAEKPSSLIFEYVTVTYYGTEGSTYEGYPTPGYNYTPWTLSVWDPIKKGSTKMIKSLTVEGDAIPWESGQTYTSDIITAASAGDDVFERFQLSCLRSRKNAGPGVAAKDATDNIEWMDFTGTAAPYNWGLAELKLWTKK